MVNFNKIIVCDCCGSRDFIELLRTEKFEYRGNIIVVKVPVISCKSCYIEYTDQRAEKIRIDAVKKSSGTK